MDLKMWSTHRGPLPHQIQRELHTVVKRRVVRGEQRIFKQHLLAHVFVPELQEVLQSLGIFDSFVAAQNGQVEVPWGLRHTCWSPRSRFSGSSSAFGHFLLSFTHFTVLALVPDLKQKEERKEVKKSVNELKVTEAPQLCSSIYTHVYTLNASIFLESHPRALCHIY